jgi:hypothetical protein
MLGVPVPFGVTPVWLLGNGLAIEVRGRRNAMALASGRGSSHDKAWRFELNHALDDDIVVQDCRGDMAKRPTE